MDVLRQSLGAKGVFSCCLSLDRRTLIQNMALGSQVASPGAARTMNDARRISRK